MKKKVAGNIIVVVPVDYLSESVLQKSSMWGGVGSLASHLGILDDEFE